MDVWKCTRNKIVLGFFDSYIALQNNFPFDISMEILEKINIDQVFGVFWVNYEKDLVCKKEKY